MNTPKRRVQTATLQGGDGVQVDSGAGTTFELRGVQFIVVAVTVSTDEAVGTFHFGISPDGANYSDFAMTGVETGASATSVDAQDPANTFYAVAPSGSNTLRVSFDGEPYEETQATVILIALG